MAREAQREQARWERVLTELVAERGDALLRYAALLCGDRDDAADLVQDALVKTFGRLRNGFGVESAEAYVRRVILNTHLDAARRRTRWRRAAPLEYVPERRDADTPAVDAKLDLHDELRKLTPRERACLVLRYYDDLTVAGIAETLGISPGTVKRYLSDGLAKMAIALADDGTAADRLGPGGAAPRGRTGTRSTEGDRDAHRI
jgi:RNA polymerase sigma-70 factor (ECF subfamily)